MSLTPASVYNTYKRYQALFGRYHCGMPIGMMAAYATEESGGRQVCSGDDPNGEHSCGGQGAPLYEFGVFQIATNQEKRFGVNGSLDGLRKTIDGNFWLAGAEENANAAIAAHEYGVGAGSREAWQLSFLGFAVGPGAARRLWASALGAGYPATYDGLIQWARETGAYAISGDSGTMPATTIVRRILISASNWDAGVAAGLPMQARVPFLIPPPGGREWQIPGDVRGLIGIGSSGDVGAGPLIFGAAIVVAGKTLF